MTNQITLRQLTEKIKYWNKRGYSCWLEGKGDGSVKIVLEEDYFTIINDRRKNGWN